MSSEVLTSDAAETLGLSPRRVRQLAEAGALPHRRVGTVRVFRRDVLDVALAAREAAKVQP